MGEYVLNQCLTRNTIYKVNYYSQCFTGNILEKNRLHETENKRCARESQVKDHKDDQGLGGAAEITLGLFSLEKNSPRGDFSNVYK